MLTIRNLDVGYRAKKVLKNISFDIEKGATVVVIGPNGSGKSTLLRTLAGVQPPIAGTITVDNKDIFKLGEAQRAKLISLVTTDITSAGAFTVQQLAALGRQPHTGWLGRLSNEDKRLVNNVIERVGLKNKANRYISDISDGERQKAMIARALAQQAPLMLLDEPTSFLDVAARIDIMSLIGEVAKSGVTSLISSHDISSALSVATHVLLISPNGTVTLRNIDDSRLTSELTNLFNDKNVVFDASIGDFRAAK